VTPISAFSSTPVPGPPPSGLAGISTASLANATEAAPGAAPIEVGEASALNWLVAWLGTHQPHTMTATIDASAPDSTALQRY